jgi:hypothetical protein
LLLTEVTSVAVALELLFVSVTVALVLAVSVAVALELLSVSVTVALVVPVSVTVAVDAVFVSVTPPWEPLKPLFVARGPPFVAHSVERGACNVTIGSALLLP